MGRDGVEGRMGGIGRGESSAGRDRVGDRGREMHWGAGTREVHILDPQPVIVIWDIAHQASCSWQGQGHALHGAPAGGIRQRRGV